MSEKMENGLPGENAQGNQGTEKWVRALLALSLGANLLIAGLVVGTYAHERDQLGAPRDGALPEARVMRELGLGPFMNAFPEAKRRQMGQELRGRIGTSNMNRASLADELAAILEATRAQPYDHGELTAVIERQKQRISDRADIGRDVVLEAIEEMSPEERAAFADRMERSLRHALEQLRRPARP